MTSDPAEQLLRRLHDDAILANEIARAQNLERVVSERRRRHVRTVRSRARARNRARPHLAWILVVGVILLALAATRAAAQDGDFDEANASERLRDLDDTDALGDALSREGNDDETLSRPTRWSIDAARDGSATAGASRTAGPPASDDLAGITIKGAPPISAVVNATVRAAGLADDPVPGWRTRSRWSALVPAITSRVGNSESWREVTDPTVSRALSYDVRVSWRLDRLIYDPNEPRFAAFDISRRRERRRLIALATHAYVEWLHARAAEAAVVEDAESGGYDADAASGGSARAARRATRILMEARQAHAELDALTDGWFSHVLNTTRSR